MYSCIRGGTETNRQCFADICKSRQSRFGSKSRIYCRIDALKTINIAQRHLDNRHRQLILPICTRFTANLTLQTLADIGKVLPISLCAAPNSRNLCFYSFSASVSFDFETRIMSTCMSTSRSNYTDMSIWKKHADHSTSQ